MVKTTHTYQALFFKFIFILSLLITSLPSFGHWSTRGPYGGTVKCAAISDTSIYIGTANGGVFRNTNAAGGIWRSIGEGMTSGKVTALTTIGNYAIAGTADSGIFIVKNMGSKWGDYVWSKSNEGLGTLSITALASQDNYIYAGTTKGVYISEDSGRTWKTYPNRLSYFNINCLVVHEGIVYAGSDEVGLWYSQNHGQIWDHTNDGISEKDVFSITISNNKIFAGTSTTIYSRNLTDEGSFIPTGIDTKVKFLFSHNHTVYACTDKGILQTPDSLSLWTVQPVELPGDSINALFHFNNKLYAGTENKGIYSASGNPLNWVNSNQGLSNLTTKALAAKDNIIVCGTKNGIYVSKNTGASFSLANSGLKDSNHVASILILGTDIYATTTQGVFVSKDTCKTWSPVNKGLISMDIHHLAANNEKLFITDRAGNVYTSVINDIHWEELSSGAIDSSVTSIITFGQDVFVATKTKGIYHYQTGTGFLPSNSGLQSLDISSLALIKDTIYAGSFSTGVYAKYLNSSEWVNISSGLPTKEILSLNSTDSLLIAGFIGGVHIKSKSGIDWKAPNTFDYLPSFSKITHIAFSSARIFVGTDFNSPYSNSKEELPGYIVAVEDMTEFSKSIVLSPNPSSGIFSLTSQKNKLSDISVYDVYGKQLYFSPTSPEIFNINIPAGHYIIRFNAGENKGVKKLIIY